MILDSNPRVAGFLIDLDGVLYVGNRVLPGAIDFVDQLIAGDIPHCFLTNTTTRSEHALAKKMSKLGLRAEPSRILTAPGAARDYLTRRGYCRCHLVLNREVIQEFKGIEDDSRHPEAVIIGDIGDAWTYDLLNRIFQSVMEGAELIALHKNKFWETEIGLQLDVGAFVVGLEYATGKAATLIGKPEKAFFDAALSRLGLEAGEAAMIGDDVDSDIEGAQKCGIRGILVRTGKFREDYFQTAGVRPERLVDSIQDLVKDLPSSLP